MLDKKVWTAIFAAIGASLCCITPVLAVLAGSTGLASSFSWMEPYRPFLVAVAIVVLAYAWWDKLKPKKQDLECACDPDEDGNISFWHTQKFLAIVTVFAIIMLLFPYWGDALIKSDKVSVENIPKSHLSKMSINIEGMTCKACEATVEKIGGEVRGVALIKASVDQKKATVEFDNTQTDIQSIMQAIGTTGYKPVSYEDSKGKHRASNVKITQHKEFKKLETSKCGGGKCGAGKCGSGKCGTK